MLYPAFPIYKNKEQLAITIPVNYKSNLYNANLHFYSAKDHKLNKINYLIRLYTNTNGNNNIIIKYSYIFYDDFKKAYGMFLFLLKKQFPKVYKNILIEDKSKQESSFELWYKKYINKIDYNNGLIV